ncbi:MAG: aldehyde dehydrogenase family protein, partial [Candidatus Baltobacteraceae bacterium]
MFEYAPAPESAKVQIREQYGLFINGKWTAPAARGYFDTINPANEQKLARIAHADDADVDKAVAAARHAYDKYWRKLRPIDRAKYVYRIARAITERSRELAILETLNGGKPIKESRDFDVPLSAAHFFYYAGWADKLEWALRAGERPHPIGVA